ncbi:MAG: ABC transporter permease [Chloroflexi bacterium]|nr:ABC transporter permease [Chloroflexota bacterium]
MEHVHVRAPARHVTHRSLQPRLETVVVGLVFVAIVLTWEFGVRVFAVKEFILPAPSRVVEALLRGLAAAPGAREGYWLHAGITLSEALEGFFIGSALGILLGTLVSQSRWAELILRPYIVAFQSLPRIAMAPLFIVWFGYGVGSKIFICALATFFPLLINSIAGFESVDEERIELMRGMAASRWQIFRKVQFPSALPYIFAGLDMAIVYAVIGALVGEFVGAQQGLGVLILQMNFALDIAGVFSVFVVLSIMGVALNWLLNEIRRRVLFWAPIARRRRIVGT